MNIEDIKVDEFEVEFSDPKSTWSEIVDFADFFNAILDFIKKILKFEFDL